MALSEPERRALLARCAPLRRFDRDILCELLGCDPATADALLASPEVEPFGEGFHLRPTVASVFREQLLADDPHAEAALHSQAFALYLARLQRVPGAARAIADEDECLYYLDALFMHLANRLQWQTLRRYAVQALRARPQRLKHRRRLIAFAGYAAIRLQKYARGETLLTGLLGAAELEPDVKLKAIKALADGSWFRSRYGEAAVRYEQLYQAAREVGDATYQGMALLNRSIVFHELGVYDRALDGAERSLAILRASGDQTRAAHALYHVALYSLHLGRWDAARDSWDEAAIQYERLGLLNYLGFISWCQGLLAHIFGDAAASEAAYLRGLAIAESTDDEEPSLALDSYVNLGALHHSFGDHLRALDAYERALAYARRLDRDHQICLIHFRRGQVFERLGRPGRAFLAYRSAIAYAERVGATTTREDIKIGLLGTTQQVYEAMVLLCAAFHERGGKVDWAAQAFGYVERARSRAFLDALAQKSSSVQLDWLEAAAPASLPEIQAGLPDDALLIEYFTTGVLPRGEFLINRLPPANRALRDLLALQPQVLAFAIDRRRCTLFEPALDPNRLRPLLGDRHPGRHLLLGSLPRTLHEQLIAPAAPLLAAKRLLYLVPHGPLHYIPFAALRTPAGGYLIDRPEGDPAGGLALAQAPSATILVRSCLGRPRAGGAGSVALGFNDAQGPQPLRFAEAEAEHVAGLLGGQAWTGAQPKGERLRSAGGLRCLHIASHALFTPGDPLGSWLLLGEEDRLSAREIIERFDLQVDLVILSSCTSGISHVVPGDELLGLPRGLLYAGAPTVVCTRWEAIDLVALLVMDRFYAELHHHSPAVALRNAQLAVRELTLEQLARTLEAWRAQGGALAAAIGDPAQLLAELTLVARDALAEPERPTTDPRATVAAAPPIRPARPADPQARPFAAPLLWAPFMVIGRA